VRLPRGVERVRARGRTYYYWNPGRGTDRESERVPLPNADDRPADLWREIERRIADAPTIFPAGSVGELVERYRASEEFKSKSESTQSSYSVHPEEVQRTGSVGSVARSGSYARRCACRP
jgi:hypothetical protein